MKLVRIERLAPGGAAVELHPRLTVLAGAPPETRRRLIQTVRAVVGVEEPECSGTIEVSGVLLALDRPTLDQLRLDPRIDPVLAFAPSVRAGTTDQLREVPTGQGGPDSDESSAEPLFGRRTPAGPSVEDPSFDDPWSDDLPSTSPAASVDTTELRIQLRGVTSERTRLGERMEAARRGLDSFSRASLDVCRGQIEALEARRAAIRREWESARDEIAARRAELRALVEPERARMLLARASDPAAVRAAHDRLAELVDTPPSPDPEALELADRLSASAHQLRGEAEERRHAADRVAVAADQLAAAREELAQLERSTAQPGVDPSVVRRLEAIRDELFASDDRTRLLGSARAKRRIQELRAEEAVLLDRLGFDTYSAYVMGIPSVRADLERSERIDAARERVERAEHELGIARSEERPETAARRALTPLLGAVERTTGWTLSVDVSAEAEELAAHLHAVADELRRWRAIDGGEHAELHDAARALAAALRVAGAPAPGGTPEELLAAARQWLAGAPERAAAAAEAERRVEQLEAELASLDAAREPRHDVEQWAAVEAELDAALDRLADAEDRVRSHEEAMDLLAELRSEELLLRERERALLASIAEEESRSGPTLSPDAVVSPHDGVTTPVPASPWVTAPPAGRMTPPPFNGVVAPPQPAPESPAEPSAEAIAEPVAAAEAAPGATTAPARGWALVARLAEQRAVSFAGAVPLVLDGLPAEQDGRDTVLQRAAAMSDLVQIVVLTDDEEVVEQVLAMGPDAAVLRV